MNNLFKKIEMVINYKIFSKRWVPTMLLIFIVSACSLDIEGTDSIILPEEEGIFNGVTDVSSSLDGLFQDLRGQHESQDNFYALVTVATDELLVPTRGTDWGDNGIWRTLHAHTWSPSHKYLLTVWNQFNQNIFRATEVIDPRSGGTPAQVAEAKFVRAYSMWQIMELYGIVPFRGPDDGPDVNPIVKTRTEAYGDILQDLTQALADLPASGGVGNIRPTKAAAHYLLAKVKLNAHIYDGTGTPSAGTMTEVVGHVDAIEAEGFGLGAVGEYFDLFVEGTDTETIWYTESSVGNRMWNGLHYHQVTPTQTGGGWNGFTTLAEFYDTFEGDANTNQEGDGEERRGFTPNEFNSDATNWGIGSGFLLGRQWRFDNDNGAVALNDRAGGPLVFTKQLPGLVGNGEASGIRVMKYSPGNGDFAGHLVMFRYADAHLMRAEAILNGGTAGSNGTALAEVNDLRASRGGVNGAALTILTSLTADILLEERGRELYTEMWRRNDMIRFGKFTRGWEFKDAGSVGDVKWNLYPIPSDALLSNPNLQQNDGY
jgi:hypothetical protein